MIEETLCNLAKLHLHFILFPELYDKILINLGNGKTEF